MSTRDQQARDSISHLRSRLTHVMNNKDHTSKHPTVPTPPPKAHCNECVYYQQLVHTLHEEKNQLEEDILSLEEQMTDLGREKYER